MNTNLDPVNGRKTYNGLKMRVLMNPEKKNLIPLAKINHRALEKVVKINPRKILVESTWALKVGRECLLSFKFENEEIVVNGIAINCEVSSLSENRIFYKSEIKLKKFIKGNPRLLRKTLSLWTKG